MERVAVDRSEARRVETVLVDVRRQAPVVRGVFVARGPAGVSTSGPGAGDVFLVADREPGDQSDGGGFGPPPPPVPFDAPGEGGGLNRTASTGNSPPSSSEPQTLIQRAACDTRDALGQSGTPLDSACSTGSRGLVRETVTDAVGVGDGGVSLGLGGAELTLVR